MNTLIFILLVLSFGALVVYLMRGGNVMYGFVVIAIVWSILGGLNLMQIQGDIFHTAAVNYGSTVVIFAFGAWFGRVMMATGIIENTIRKVVELGGSRRFITWLLLTVTTYFIFWSSWGAGPVIAIGLITVPIMMALGIPKAIAVGSMLMAIGAGGYVNITCWTQFIAIFPNVTYQEYFNTGIKGGLLHLGMIIVFLIFHTVFKKGERTWAAAVPETEQKSEKKGMFFLAYLTPLVPVGLTAFLKWQPVSAFFVSIFWALIFTGNLLPWKKKGMEITLKALKDAFGDIGMLLMMLIMVMVFSRAATLCAPIISSFLGPYVPTNPLIVAIVVGILAPIALFRGPLNFWGAGAAIAVLFLNMGAFSEIYCFFLVIIPTLSISVSTCPTQSWNLWALDNWKMQPRDLLKTNLIWCWASTTVIAIVFSVMIGG